MTVENTTITSNLFPCPLLTGSKARSLFPKTLKPNSRYKQWCFLGLELFVGFRTMPFATGSIKTFTPLSPAHLKIDCDQRCLAREIRHIQSLSPHTAVITDTLSQKQSITGTSRYMVRTQQGWSVNKHGGLGSDLLPVSVPFSSMIKINSSISRVLQFEESRTFCLLHAWSMTRNVRAAA